ncbi:MAG: ATP-binding cassette domain-containing protein [Leptospiraceae bacterium]|nr:ATP-binding cassette domain-containing protein [Leptospiraceae bacterium]MDW7976202.1 ATP-binding cassette domain-containing protein [Leptospiraceae bacterium]
MEIHFLNIFFVRQNQILLDNINISLDQNHYVILGPNGSGKTTLLNILSGHEWPSKGKCIIKENQVLTTPPLFKDQMGIFLPKIADWILAFHPKMSVLETICTGFYQQLGYYTEAKPHQIDLAIELLKKYLPSLQEKHYYKSFHTLSTGEKYRTLLLRSIVKNPKILILDEPFENLDIKGRIEFEELLYEISKYTSFIIIVLHRIEEIPSFVSKSILMKNGRIFRYGNIKDTLTSENLSELYELPLDIQYHENRYYAIIKSKRS